MKGYADHARSFTAQASKKEKVYERSEMHSSKLLATSTYQDRNNLTQNAGGRDSYQNSGTNFGHKSTLKLNDSNTSPSKQLDYQSRAQES